MVTYYVEKDEIYKVSATVNCAVYDASGSTIATCDAGSIVTFKAPTDKILISDNNAALNCISESASGDLSGLTEHVNNSAIHVTAAEKANWNSVVSKVTEELPNLDSHAVDSTRHITADERIKWDFVADHGDMVWDINKMYPGTGGAEQPDFWIEYYAIQKLREHFYNMDVANGDTDPDTGLTISKKYMVPGVKIRYYRNANSEGDIPSPFWCTTTWEGGNIDWSWVAGTNQISDDFTDPGNWKHDVPDHSFDWMKDKLSAHEQNTDLHVTNADRVALNDVMTIVNEVVGEYQYTSARSVEGTTDMTIKWAQLCLSHVPSVTGDLHRVIIPCRVSSTSTEMSSEPLYLGLWYEDSSGAWQKLGVSSNTVSQIVATDSVWYFDGVKVESVSKLRFGLLSNPEDDFSSASDFVLYCRGVSSSACSNSCYVTNLNDASQPYSLDVTLECRAFVSHATYVTADDFNAHAADTTVHVTAEEREAWNAALSGGTTDSGTSSFDELNVTTLNVDNIEINGSLVKNGTAEGLESVLNWGECNTLYAPKNYGTANAVLITDANGNITASTIISVSELNTLNNNLTNLATKLADLESRLAALETA